MIHFLRLRAIALALRVLRLRAIALALRVLRLRVVALGLHGSFTLTEQDSAVRVGDTTVRIDRSNVEPTVVVTGRVTVDSSPHLRSVLFGLIHKNAGRLLVVDLSGVSHIEISGFATLLEALNCAHEHSIRLRLAGVNGQPRRLAELAQLDEIFRAVESEVEFS